MIKVYDTLIIGSGYFSLGYAASHENTVICESSEGCDTGFCLPISGFKYHPYAPKSRDGERLLQIFESLSLFSGGMQNTSAFECALCKYICEAGAEVLLKCRVISTDVTADGMIDATVQTNEGLSHIFTRKIIDTRAKTEKKRLTVLFVTENIRETERELCAAFDGAFIEPAFYENRYALYIPVGDTDVNRVKIFVYEKWKNLTTDAKIIYIAPAFYSPDGSQTSDTSYNNPIEAFDAGYFFGKEAKK